MGKANNIGKGNPKNKRTLRPKGTIHHKYPEEIQAIYEQLIRNAETYRTTQKITKDELRIKMGVSNNIIRFWLNFDNEPSLGNFIKLIEGMGTDIATIATLHLPPVENRPQQKIDEIHEAVMAMLSPSQKRDIKAKKMFETLNGK